MCFSHNLIVFLFEHITPFDNRHEVLRLPDLPLQPFPDLVSCELWRSSRRVYLLGISAMDNDTHDDFYVMLSVAILSDVRGLEPVTILKTTLSEMICIENAVDQSGHNETVYISNFVYTVVDDIQCMTVSCKPARVVEEPTNSEGDQSERARLDPPTVGVRVFAYSRSSPRYRGVVRKDRTRYDIDKFRRTAY